MIESTSLLGGNILKIILKLLQRDIKSIIKYPSVFALILLLCFLPSSYAWISIKTSWDPYSNTSKMPIGIVNNDTGANFKGKNINVGNEIVKDLKKNKSINWIFIDDWQGNYKLNSGKYYSLIEIPSDFSSKLLTLISTSPEKPNIIYKSNEKMNGIATKITDSAKAQLADNIKSTFIETINKEILKELNPKGKKLEIDKPKILQLKDDLPGSINTVNQIKNQIYNENSDSENLNNYLGEMQSNNLPKLSKEINNLHNIIYQSKDITLLTRDSLTSIQENLKNDINEMESKEYEIQSLLNNIKNIIDESGGSSINQNIIDNMIYLNNILLTKTNTNIKILTSINGVIHLDTVNELINSLVKLRNNLNSENYYLANLKKLINDNSTKDSINAVIDNLLELNIQISDIIVNFSNGFYSGTYNTLNLLSNTLTSNLDRIDSSLDIIQGLKPELNTMASLGITNNNNLVDQRNNIDKKLTDIKDKLNNLYSKMNYINDSNLNSIINIMEKNPDTISNFISSPIKVKNVELYNSGLFGYGVTPFYTTLAIWVGALLLCTILTTKCKDLAGKQKTTLTHKYFAKCLLFLIISIIQTIIIILGNIFIVGVNPENPWLMIGFALICSFTFTIIITTLVFLLGNIGKAISVIIMVFQIAGAGGIYPIKTLPQIFGVLAPLWPFTYAINGFREAIAGPIWANVFKDSFYLISFAAAFLLISTLKKPLHKLTEIFECEFEKSDL